MKQGLLVSIVSPSGGGKTTVVNELVRQLPRTVRFVTSTTRAPRQGETDGIDYHFLTKSEFVYKISQGELLEHVEFAGNYYGTDRAELEKMLLANDFVLAPIDVRGSVSLKAFPYRQIRIFLKPENLMVLEARLARRPGMTPAELGGRLAYAEQEIAQASGFDAVVLNREGFLAETVAEVKELLTQRVK